MTIHQPIDLESLLERLCAQKIEFVVVGGVAGVLLGAPLSTQDLDIVPRLSGQNISSLHELLIGLEAKIRDSANRELVPTIEQLQAGGQLRLWTKLGPLDILGKLHDGRGYEELFDHTIELREGSLRLRILDLDTLIEIKSNTGRARDKLALAVLIALKRDISQTD